MTNKSITAKTGSRLTVIIFISDRLKTSLISAVSFTSLTGVNRREYHLPNYNIIIKKLKDNKFTVLIESWS